MSPWRWEVFLVRKSHVGPCLAEPFNQPKMMAWVRVGFHAFPFL